jgi:surfeit locus 1 family protein
VTSPSNQHTPRTIQTLVVIFITASLALAGFISLGVWQVKRLAWKEALMARVAMQVKATPVAAPGPTAWSSLQRDTNEYQRLQVRGRFDHAHETLVRATTELGAGYWVLTPLRSDQGFWVLVNRGFVPPELRERATRQAQEPQNDQDVLGLLRLSEPGGSMLQKNDATQQRWYSRDVQAIVVAQGLTDQTAPYFIDASAPDASAPAVGWPRPGLTVLRFSNNHLVYALTWFALAAMTAGALGYLVADERRLRRLAGAPTGHDEHANQ